MLASDCGARSALKESSYLRTCYGAVSSRAVGHRRVRRKTPWVIAEIDSVTQQKLAFFRLKVRRLSLKRQALLRLVSIPESLRRCETNLQPWDTPMLNVGRWMEEFNNWDKSWLVCDGDPAIAFAVSNKTLPTELLHDRRFKSVPPLQVTKCIEARTYEPWKEVLHINRKTPDVRVDRGGAEKQRGTKNAER